MLSEFQAFEPPTGFVEGDTKLKVKLWQDFIATIRQWMEWAWLDIKVCSECSAELHNKPLNQEWMHKLSKEDLRPFHNPLT